MEYPQHLCVVSTDESLRDQVSRSFLPVGMTVQWVGDWAGLLGGGFSQQVCLLIDAGLALGGSGPEAAAVSDWLARRPAQNVIVLREPQSGLEAGANRLYDVLVQRAEQLLDKPVGMDQLAFALQNIMRKRRAGLARSQAADSLQADGFALWQFDPVAMVLVPPSGESFALSASEARLIALLITKDPEPVRRQDLIALFGIKSPNIRRIDTTIYRLRHKIEHKTGFSPPFSTVHGVGYRNEGLRATVSLSF